jgi:hypothetical protein
VQWMPLDLQKSRSLGLCASQIAVDNKLCFFAASLENDGGNDTYDGLLG